MSTVEQLEKQIKDTKEKIAGYNKGKETKKKKIACDKSMISEKCKELTKVVKEQFDDKTANKAELKKLEGKLKKAKIEEKAAKRRAAKKGFEKIKF